MSKNKVFKDETLFQLEKYCILKGYRGSIAHGTYDEETSGDDKDIMGVFIPPPNEIFGLKQSKTIEKMWNEKLSQKRTITWDVVYYDLKKYINLLLKQNPNVIMLLWLSEKHYLKITSLGKQLINKRREFLSKKCYHSFCGYAYGQLHRMTHHSPTGKMGKKRKKLVEKHGYDCKNASHLIRLLKMGLETLSTGEMLVERPDNNMLLEIKRGEWKIQQVLDYSMNLFKKLETALIHSTLPNYIDESFANQLCQKVIIDFYKKRELKNE